MEIQRIYNQFSRQSLDRRTDKDIREKIRVESQKDTTSPMYLLIYSYSGTNCD